MVALANDVARVFVPLLSPSRYKGAHGGRGSAKSHFFAGHVVTESVRRKCDVVCIREVQRTLNQSVKKLIEQKIEALNAGSYFCIQDARITSKRGGVIIFEGMQNHTAESIKSLEGFDVAWVEEAQSLSQRSLDILRPTIRKPASELWFSWNPSEPTDPIDVLLRGSAIPSNAIVIQTSYRDNPWFPDVLKSELEYDRNRDPEKYLHVWEGGYQRYAEARVFKNWRIEEFDIDPSWILRQGADWGFSVDPSVLVQCAIVGRSIYVTREAYMVGCEVDMLPDLFRTVPDAERWPIVADSARPETISYMQRHGFPRMFTAVKGKRSVEEGVEFLRSYDIIVHPRCTHTADELSSYRYRVDDLTGQVIPILDDKDNHVIDALRYACEGARRAHGQASATPELDPTPGRGVFMSPSYA